MRKTEFGEYEISDDQIHELKVHPFAATFPLIDGEEFTELVNDIRNRGLREPIVLDATGTTIIDGRNRYRACLEGDCDPVFKKLGSFYSDRMLAEYIISANIQRRHLTPGQRSIIGLKFEEMYAQVNPPGGDASGNETTRGDTIPADRPESYHLDASHSGEARENAGKAVGVSGRAISRAKAIERDAPDLLKPVQAGRMSLDAADKERKKRVASRPRGEKEQPTTQTLTLRTHEGQAVLYPKPKSKASFNPTPGEGISWAAWSWNPVTGCLHNCEYCYAREIATQKRTEKAFPVGFTPLFHHERLDAPRNTPVPPDAESNHAYRRVFVCSMADLYGKWVPAEWINQIHESCTQNPQWDYLLLTKFPSRYLEFKLPPTSWAGTSVDKQFRVSVAERAFREINNVGVKWLSLEPLLEPLEFTDLSMFDWVVIGAQTETVQPSGTVKAFAPQFDWVARIVAQAREAGCRVHLKPNLLGNTGPQFPGMLLPDEYPIPRRTHIEDSDAVREANC